MTDPDLVVLQSFPPPQRVNNPYTSLLLGALQESPGVTVHPFSWRTALTGRYDVLHLHWPETLIERRGRLSTAVRQLCFVLLLLRCLTRRTAIVRTMHNLELPSGLPAHQIALLRLVERITTLRIVLNETTPAAGGQPVEVVPHGHYRDWYRVDGVAGPVPGRLAFFGRIRRYKRADLLVRAFTDLRSDADLPDLSLRIAGRVSSDELADELRSLAAADPRIGLSFDYVDDDAMVALVREAELIVLPYPEMHNSGTVLAALSLDRPVLVRDNEANRRLAAEVGSGWVVRYEGELTAADIRGALRLVRGEAVRRDGGPVRPDLARRDWSEGGRRHVRAYRRAVRAEASRSRRARLRAG